MTGINKKDIKKGMRFYWSAGTDEYRGFYEIICFKKDLNKILCFKEAGKRSAINTEEFSKFDERIIRNADFWKVISQNDRSLGVKERKV